MKKNITNQKVMSKDDPDKLFRHIVEDIEILPIFVHEFMKDGKCVYVNNACCNHFQKPKELLIGVRLRDFSQTYPDGDFPDQAIESLLAGNTITFEDKHIIATGELIPVEVTVHCFTENGVQYAVSYCVDIRERKKIEKYNLEMKENQARLEAESHFKRLVEAYPDPLVRTDLNGEITYAREDVASHYGYAAEQMYGHKLCDLAMSAELQEPAKTLTEAAIKAAAENKPVTYEEWVSRDGRKDCVEVRHIPERDKNGRAIGVLGFSRVITGKAIQSQILHFLAKAGSFKDNSFFDEMVLAIKQILFVDCVGLFLLDQNQVDITVKSSSDQWLDNGSISFSIDDSLFKNSLDESQIYYASRSSGNFPVSKFLSEQSINSLVCVPLVETGNNILGFLSIFNRSEIDHLDAIKNIIGLLANSVVSRLERLKFEESERARAEEFRILIENSPDYISRFDKDLNCIYVNPVLASIGFAPGNSEKYSHVAFIEQIADVLRTGVASSKVHRGLTPKNEKFDIETRVICERDKDGGITGAMVIGRDISDRIMLEEKLRKQAEVDALTGLPNRRALTGQLNFALANAKRQNNHVGLLFVDLDRFKAINDTLGHDMGDQLLQEAARRLQQVVRESDMVARFGGDEFVVLLTALKDPVQIVKVSESIISMLAKPFYLDTMTTYLSASVGIANFPNDTETASELIAHADQAMYIAKQQGRNTYRFFTPSMQAEADERLLLLNDLRVALAKEQLSVVFQPIVHGATGQTTKAEVLLRWQHPEKGFISPDKFIPLAEDTGLIDEIGDWVFRQSVAFAKLWQQQSTDIIQVSINISPRQFNQDSIVTKWLSWLSEVDLPAKHITLEVTETLLLDEQDGLQEKINQFRESGVQFALDDFGTGYSAMSYLKKFHLDFLKIDGSFIRDMTNDSSDRAIVETISVMATRLGMKSIAECVETEEQGELLLSFGCDYIQGYLHSKPLSKDDFLSSNLLRKKH